MANQINLQIITPTKKVFDEMVDMVVLNSVEGELGILYNHTPIVAMLTYGALRYKQNGQTKQATSMGGFAEVTKEKVVVLTDASEKEEDIDVARAKAAKERAEANQKNSSMDTHRAEIALKKALVRLNTKK